MIKHIHIPTHTIIQAVPRRAGGRAAHPDHWEGRRRVHLRPVPPLLHGGGNAEGEWGSTNSPRPHQNKEHPSRQPILKKSTRTQTDRQTDRHTHTQIKINTHTDIFFSTKKTQILTHKHKNSCRAVVEKHDPAYATRRAALAPGELLGRGDRAEARKEVRGWGYYILY